MPISEMARGKKTSHPCILAFSHNARIHIGFRCTHILIWLCPGMCVSATTVLFCLPSDSLNISIPWTLENDKFSVYYSGTKWMSILPSETTSNQQQCVLSRQDWLKSHMKTIIRSPELQVYILDVFFFSAEQNITGIQMDKNTAHIEINV